MTILASLWLRVEYQAMRYTPWVRLARWRAESLGSPNDRARRSASRTLLVDYPNMWGYARELHQWPGVAPTVAMEQIKEHYYTTHDELNPKRIIPVGPAYDWSEPHGRG